MVVESLSKRRDVLGRYYTSDPVSALLVHAMDLTSAHTVLDLGSGDGALTAQASIRWPAARFHTVDIDEDAGCRRLAELDGATFRHHTGDALDYRLHDHIGLKDGGACAAVCNPPYIRPKWQKHFGAILEDAGLSDVLPKLGDAPADLLFIAQNLRYLRPGGRLGLIVPDGLISGERYRRFRSRLLERHSVHEVIELPISIFRYTEAKAHILIVSKEASPTQSTKVRRLDANGRLSDAISILRDEGERRLDYSHIWTRDRTRRPTGHDPVPLSSLIDSIARGTYSSSEREGLEFPVLHTTNLTRDAKNVSTRLALTRSQRTLAAGPMAAPGDIVVARVGRNLHEKVALVARGYYAVSDCIFVLRPKPGRGRQILDFLRSDGGRQALAASAHGVGAKFITATALSEMPMVGV
jgi:type I restriction enzyme M protein